MTEAEKAIATKILRNKTISYPFIIAPQSEHVILKAMEAYHTSQLQKEKEGEGKEIQCPYCDGKGWTAEHNHQPDEPCKDCPVQMPCGYCYGNGTITTELMKKHIAQTKTFVIDKDDLPF